MKLSKVLLMAGFAAVLTLGANNVLAQGGGRNFDPAQMRERMMTNYKEQLGVTDDTEWKAIEPLVGKVMDANMALRAGGPRGMGPGGRNRGGNNQDNPDRPQRPNRPGAEPSPVREALQKAVDAKAPSAEIKPKLEAFRAEQQKKEAALTKAQDDLKKVLTPQQEAAAVLAGLLK